MIRKTQFNHIKSIITNMEKLIQDLKRLLEDPTTSAETRDLVKQMLDDYEAHLKGLMDQIHQS